MELVFDDSHLLSEAVSGIPHALCALSHLLHLLPNAMVVIHSLMGLRQSRLICSAVMVDSSSTKA